MRDEITAWMKQKRSEVPIPVYGSVDVRDAGWKIGVVDANHFPAGFNNVSKENLAELSTLFKEHINRTHPDCMGPHLPRKPHPQSRVRGEHRHHQGHHREGRLPVHRRFARPQRHQLRHGIPGRCS